MKKIFIIAAMAVAGITTANAQEFKVGAKAGLLLSDISSLKYPTDGLGVIGTAKYNTAIKPGFHFGAFIEYGFNEKIWVEAGIDYAFQGAKLKSYEFSNGSLINKTNLKSSSEWTTQQFNIPLWFKYDFNGFRPKVGVNLGLLTNINLDVNIDNPTNPSSPDNKVSFSPSPDNAFDFSLAFGAEYNLNSGLFFDATFNLGLSELSTKEYSKDKDGKLLPSVKFKNSAFQIGVGYKF